MEWKSIQNKESFFVISLQILEVNGQNFENVQLTKANEILKNNTHLSITVKTNLLGKASDLKQKKKKHFFNIELNLLFITFFVTWMSFCSEIK